MRGATASATDDETRRALLAAARSFDRARALLEKRREELHAAIAASVANGATVSQVARDTGYTREYVSALVGRGSKAKRPADA